jgi:Fe2+ or Zn2+ uptake regulation protein
MNPIVIKIDSQIHSPGGSPLRRTTFVPVKDRPAGDDLEELHTTVAQRLRTDGLRYTGSRRAVVDVLARSDRPLTIPEILDRDPSLAQSSAYRNLTELITAGVVHRLVAGDEFSHFELAEDLTAHHHHLVCTRCGRVADMTLDERLERRLDAALTAVAADQGFTPEHHRLDVLGICGRCA